MLTSWLLVPTAWADPTREEIQLCDPPATLACTLLDPTDPNCNPFTWTQVDTDSGGYTDNPDYIQWECVTDCVPSVDWETDCSYDAHNGAATEQYARWDDTGASLVTSTARRVSMVVNGIGVTLEYTDDGYDDGSTVVFHAGGGSNIGFSTGSPIRNYLRAYSNTRTVAIKYELGAALVGPDGGWHIRDSADPSTYYDQTMRTAAVLAWIRDELQNSGEGLGTVACSMGTLATLAAPVWHGMDGDFDHQVMIGGPPMWDVNAGCGRLGVTYMDPYDAGIVGYEILGGTHLGTGDYCNTNSDHCLTYWPVRSAALKNHVHRVDKGSTNACWNSEDAAAWPPSDDAVSAFEDSSWNAVASPDWTLSHPVDFFVDRTLNPTGDCDGTNCPDTPFFDDGFSAAVSSDEISAGPSNVRVYQTLLDNGSNATWTWQEGSHCDSLEDNANTRPAIDAVVGKLAVEAVRHELRVVKHEDNFTATDTCLEVDAGASENTFSSSETLTVNGHAYRVGTYHDDSGSPELQATIATGTVFDLPTDAVVDRVVMLISGSTGASSAPLVKFTYEDASDEVVVASIPTDDTTTGVWSGTNWEVRPWSGDVTGNGSGCADGAFEVRVRNPNPNLFPPVSPPADGNVYHVDEIEITYGGALAGPLAMTILTNSDTWEEVVAANTLGGCQTSEPITTACELEPVRTYWNGP